MAKAVFCGITPDGNEKWGTWTVENNIVQNIIDFCRYSFVSKYKDMWIYPIYFDDRYFKDTQEFFKEVGVVLYPRLTNIEEYFKNIGYTGEVTIRLMREHSEEMRKIAHADLKKNEKLGTKPIYVVIKGKRTKRFWGVREYNEYTEVIRSIKEVSGLSGGEDDYY